MAKNKATVKIDTQYDSTGIDKAKKGMKGLQDTSGKTAKSFLSMAKTVAGPLAIGAIIAGTIRIGKEFSDLSADAEEIQSKFDVVFGDASDSVQSWADVYSDSVGRSESDTLKFLGSMKDLLTPMGFIEDAAVDLSKEIVTLANDIGSFNDQPTANVIRDIQAAMTGGGETVKKYGVIVNVATIKQEALTSGLWDGVGALDAQVKAQAAWQLIAKGSAAATGDLLRTQESSTNVSIRLAAAQKDLGIAIGDLINRGVTPLESATATLTKSLAEWIARNTEIKDFLSSMETGSADASAKIDTMAASLETLENRLEGFNEKGGIGRQNLIDQIAALKILIAQRQRGAALEEQFAQAKKDNDVAEQTRIAKAKADNDAAIKDMETLLEAYGNTTEGQKEALEATIAYFEEFKKGPMAIAVLDMLNEKLEKYNEEAKITTDIFKGLTPVADEWHRRQLEGYQDQIDAAEEYQDTLESLTSDGLGAFASAFKAMGEEGKSGWEVIQQAGKDAISAVLEALAQQFLVQAAAAAVLLNFVAAAGWTAVAAAAFAASGAVQNFATGGSFTTAGPTPIVVGDNPSGQEEVTITPVGGERNQAGEERVYAIVDGGEGFWMTLQRGIDNRQLHRADGGMI